MVNETEPVKTLSRTFIACNWKLLHRHIRNAQPHRGNKKRAMMR